MNLAASLQASESPNGVSQVVTLVGWSDLQPGLCEVLPHYLLERYHDKLWTGEIRIYVTAKNCNARAQKNNAVRGYPALMSQCHLKTQKRQCWGPTR